MISEKLEKSINDMLQQKVSFTVNGKSIKSGKLILFCIKDFYLVFTLVIQHSKKIFEIPYPYEFRTVDKKIILDYTLESFCHNMGDIKNHAKLLLPKKPNKFHNSLTEITIVDNI